MTRLAEDVVISLTPPPYRGRGDRARRWTVWMVELALIFAVLLGLDAAMRPNVQLLQASPHVFWLPVVAMAVLYGTPAGLVAALVATAFTWVGAPSLSPAEADHYTQWLWLWKEPVLWLLAALALGAHRDRQAEIQTELEVRAERAEVQSGTIAAHAGALREHIDRLEHCIALALPEPAGASRSGVHQVELSPAPREPNP